METILHNTEKNGIEISFDYHVTDETKAWFRSNSFRWSKRGNVWWRPFSEQMWTKVHEYFKQSNVPVIAPNTTCDICGKEVKKYGMGTHKRMAHGIVIKRTVTTISKQGETYQRVLRPSAYVPVMSTNQEIRIEAAKPIIPDADYVGKIKCFRCNGWFELSDIYWTNKENPYGFDVCFDCHCKDNPTNTVGKITDLAKRHRT